MGRIFAIKKYAIHDGPSIRTTVFFKGCPLRCAWCHNPEGISQQIQRIWLKDRCAGCNRCIDECHAGALSIDLTLEKENIIRGTDRCAGCNHCIDICPALAHEASGWDADVEQIMEAVIKDIPFYDQSGGGVTFSGGDPLFQPQFLLELLKACRDLNLHRAVDTCAYTNTRLLKDIAGLTDLFLIDIKHMDSKIHKSFTGVPNESILENIRLLAKMKKEIRFRIPLIKEVNSDFENIETTGRFIAGIAPASRVDLLPYHEMAASKYVKLGMPVSHQVFTKPNDKDINRCAEQLEGFGLEPTIGG